MEARLLTVLALLGAAYAAPQLRLSEKSHIALNYATGGGTPLHVYSANRVYKGIESGHGNVVVLDLEGLSHSIGGIDSHSHESVEVVAATRTAGPGSSSLPATANSLSGGGLGLTAVLDSLESAESPFDTAEDLSDALEDAAEDAREALNSPLGPVSRGGIGLALLDSVESPERSFSVENDAFDDSPEVFLGAIGAGAAGIPPAAAAPGLSLRTAVGGGVPLAAAAAAAGAAPGPAAGGVPLSAAGTAPAAGGAANSLIAGLIRAEAEAEAAEEFLEASQDAAEIQRLRQAAQAAAASGNTLLAGQLMREAAEEAAEAARDTAEDAAELEALRGAAAAAAASGNTLLAQQLMAEAAEEAAEIALEAAANARAAGGAANFAQEVAQSARRAAAVAAEDAREFVAGNVLSPRVPAATGAINSVPLPGLQALVRKKRQSSDDDDDFSLSRAEETAFALSSLGTLLGANVGRWFDETYDANVKFFNGMERTGTIVLDQVDAMLEEEKDFGR